MCTYNKNEGNKMNMKTVFKNVKQDRHEIQKGE